MKKRIIALVLCIMMLTVSLSSCGVVIGGFEAPNLLSKLTVVMSSENYSINLGMMTYYYNNALKNMSLSTIVGGFSSSTDKIVTSVGDDEVKYYVSADLDDKIAINGGSFGASDNVIIYDKVTDFEISEGALSGNVIISDGTIIGGLVGENIMNTALEQAREILTYCELADMHGITLSEEELLLVESDVREYAEYMSYQGRYSDNSSGIESFAVSFVTEMLTDESDIELAATYARLAEKTKNWYYENIEAGVFDYEVEQRYDTQEHFEGDEENTRNIYFIFTENESLAYKTASNLKDYEGMYAELFVEVVRDEFRGIEASCVEGYSRGSVGSDSLDEWIFNANVGDFTEKPIYDEKLGGYFVVYYECEGAPVWYVRVREELVAERFEEEESILKENFSISTNEAMMELFEFTLGK